MERSSGAPASFTGAEPVDPEAIWRAGVARRRPRVVVKADLLPAVSVLSTVGLVGILLGWVWSMLAPPQRLQVITGGQLYPLPEESYHRFDGIAIFVLLGMAAGLLVGAAVWLLRNRRGPVVMLAAVAGMVLASWLATNMGPSFANSRYELTGTPKVGEIVVQAPAIGSSWVLLAGPFAVALAYGSLAAWNGMPDLGRRRR